MQDEPVSIIVAAVDVDGKVHVEREAPPILRVRLGQQVHVKMLYSQHTNRFGREAYSYHLDCSLAGQTGHDQLRHHSTPLRNDDLEGALVAKLESGVGGLLSYSAEVRYAHGSWMGRLGAPEARRVTGTMRIDIVA